MFKTAFIPMLRHFSPWQTRLVTAMAASCLAVAGLAVSPASAASTPQCTKMNWSDTRLLPESSGGSTRCWMVRGNNSDAVYALQMALNECFGLYVGPNGPDGDFGGNTYTALMTYQGWMGISQDGKYGPQTAGVMAFYYTC